MHTGVVAGAKNIEARPIPGDPVHALLRLAKEVKADLVVVGNVGLNARSDKWLGSVPGNVLRGAKTDVLLVHTTGWPRCETALPLW